MPGHVTGLNICGIESTFTRNRNKQFLSRLIRMILETEKCFKIILYNFDKYIFSEGTFLLQGELTEWLSFMPIQEDGLQDSQ